MSVKVIENVRQNLGKKAYTLLNEVGTLSIEDAARFCMLKWKANIPRKTGKSARNIHTNIIRKIHQVIGKVTSPANVKAGGFLLNLFLEEGGAMGSDTPNNMPNYRLRTGYFGAGKLARDNTIPYFKGVVETRWRGWLKK